MNAYELADDVKNISNTIEALEWVQKATPLLRQQADRIEELEKEKIRAYDNGYEDGRKQNTPMTYVLDGKQVFDTTPQTNPLSDEEIEYYEHLIAKLFNVSIQQKVIGLDRIIRAILKKASEK
jgi:hypothetical protein